ncbi:unnamed protein product [Kuraishia capsulata CBS 1993]|uniref:CP-type G domain-containing protein n=1 Tax=Kuraishia capsulata CBS 1993 TaxID=1382522 RepID=W6MPM4_9ASCO|nr:uncharacterized protein KUCA_T00004270001 [Kuraishia capsulata CBS 1993]CDK28288.1 unnamed protein product [Kuraishia capsulata CBS 1993]
MPPQKIAPVKWKPPKGPKPVHHKNKNTIGLGRSIQNQRASENRVEYLPDGEMRFTTDKHEANWVKMRSVTQENALDEFLNTAELADTDFTAERGSSVRIIRVDNSDNNPYLMTGDQQKEAFHKHQNLEFELTVPRRPRWDETMTKTVLERQENEAFLEWRRQLASLQQNNDLLLTPFERNLQVWKQLWRVVERSDLVVQIVDARSPLAFRSKDLEKYVKEVDERKANLLLVNKADLLTLKQRTAWAKYFKKHNIKYTFFSALQANELLEKQAQEEAAASKETEAANEASEVVTDDAVAQPEELEKDPDMTAIVSINELESLFMKAAPGPLTVPLNGQEPKLQIGLVGYPNVGKSSTINALVGSKKVSVSSTPGKTKHFQTILLSDKVILCDCPGLVFPNFAYTNGDLVCNGVLPIDQLREITGPCQLVAQRIPKFFLEAVYGIAIPIKPIEEGGKGYPTSQELLTAYARARGYMTQGFGSADQSRAARYILKDYVNGKLLHVQPPPHDDDTPVTLEDEQAFNAELYTVDYLPETRREQLMQAARDKGLSQVDLATDLSKLTFSAHIGAKDGDKKAEAHTGTNYGGKQAALFSAGDELDREFFNMNEVRGTYAKPFHKTELPASGKKHNKKNKKAHKITA